MNFHTSFDDNIADDQVICWGITVGLLRDSLFGSTREERRRRVQEKIFNAFEELDLPGITGSSRFRISLLSAWTRYYVFKIETEGKKYVLNVLSPNSTISSFRKVLDPLKNVFKKYSQNIARPLAYSDEFLLQEWIPGVPLSELKEGDMMMRDEKTLRTAETCIFKTAKLLYRLWKDGYVYTPWDDYEVMHYRDDVILLDLTRFSRKEDDNFYDFYFGVPFTPPDVIKQKNPAYRLYFRGVSEIDYFGTSRKRYVELFLKGIASECESLEEFMEVCPPDARKTWSP